MAFSFFKFRDRLRRYASSPAVILKTLRIFLDNRVVRSSSLFDKDYYYNENPEVAILKESPSLHYLACGSAAGKNPSLAFCGAEYFALNPEARESGMNPLVHYERIGRKKGLRYTFLQPEDQKERSKFKFPTIEEHQASFPSKLKAIKQKISVGEKVKVVFFVTSAAMFPARPLFDAMLKDTLFDARIAVVPDLRGLSQADPRIAMEKCLAQLEESYSKENFCVANQLPDGSWSDILAEFDADIVCHSSPYELSDFKYNPRWCVGRQLLPIHINYGYYRSVYDRHIMRSVNYAIMWKAFFECDDSIEEYKSNSILNGNNGEIVGYVKMDALSKYSTQKASRRRILICPHHSIEGGVNDILSLSNFLRHSEFFKYLPKRYPEVDFHFRPHPFLFPVLSQTKFWGQDKVNAWRNDFLSSPNATWSNGGDYFKEFAAADAIIQDCGSYLVEWFYTGNPCCYMLKSPADFEKFTSLGKNCLSHCYIAYNTEAIDDFIKKVVINQDDILASKREKFRIRVMTNYPYATNATMGVLRKALTHSLEKD